MTSMPDATEESLVDVLRRYADEGFAGQFACRVGARLKCLSCGAESHAGDVPLHALHRLEGASDPEDEMALAAIKCPACGKGGTVALPFGTETTAEDAEVLAALIDVRRRSGIRPGL